ncbi:3-hydroxyacyl-[acyl-carrier-protein] dehydratase [Micromonospora sp. Llam0]|uniref:3-hydroxylacyl-ACP dehydratase n=1 Tax=Micromonospora sp. Llam0 TaxID=2485143 RepID=UPI000FBD504A|nr:3-hydroxylacyl-ACP dehydratase [Micromonospora sp. Llam0]ROO51996.1 3-hydroxyacyl-[acyl-carrier-protein] dehydratase [Micromonospora sp. Llam0]
MRFQLIDRIEAWQPGCGITARKVTAAAEEFWYADSAGWIVMPPELVLEVVCQAATWLIMLSSGFERRALLLAVGEMTVHGCVEPGDVLTVTATVASSIADAIVVDGRVEVEGRTVLEASGIMCALREAETLQARHDVERMARCLLRTEVRG